MKKKNKPFAEVVSEKPNKNGSVSLEIEYNIEFIQAIKKYYKIKDLTDDKLEEILLEIFSLYVHKNKEKKDAKSDTKKQCGLGKKPCGCGKKVQCSDKKKASRKAI